MHHGPWPPPVARVPFCCPGRRETAREGWDPDLSRTGVGLAFCLGEAEPQESMTGTRTHCSAGCCRVPWVGRPTREAWPGLGPIRAVDSGGHAARACRRCVRASTGCRRSISVSRRRVRVRAGRRGWLNCAVDRVRPWFRLSLAAYSQNAPRRAAGRKWNRTRLHDLNPSPRLRCLRVRVYFSLCRRSDVPLGVASRCLPP